MLASTNAGVLTRMSSLSQSQLQPWSLFTAQVQASNFACIYILSTVRRIFAAAISFVCRYSVDIQLDKTLVNKDTLRDAKSRRKARLEIKKKFEER